MNSNTGTQILAQVGREWDLYHRLDSSGECIMQMFRSRNIFLSERVLLSILSIQKNVQEITDGMIFLHWKKKHGWKLNFSKWQNRIIANAENI